MARSALLTRSCSARYTPRWAPTSGVTCTRAGEWFERNGAMAPAAFHFEQAGQFDVMVKAGYQAASQAERAGMYHTALMLYQNLRAHGSIEEPAPRLAGVLIVLGRVPARLFSLLRGPFA